MKNGESHPIELWLMMIDDEDTRSRAIANHRAFPWKPESHPPKTANLPSSAIYFGFQWEKTPEGYNHWESIYDSLWEDYMDSLPSIIDSYNDEYFNNKIKSVNLAPTDTPNQFHVELTITKQGGETETITDETPIIIDQYGDIQEGVISQSEV